MTSANTTGYIIFIKAAELICLFHPIYGCLHDSYHFVGTR